MEDLTWTSCRFDVIRNFLTFQALNHVVLLDIDKICSSFVRVLPIMYLDKQSRRYTSK